jgi:hypothetical protein
MCRVMQGQQVEPISHYLENLQSVGPDYKWILSQNYFGFLNLLIHTEPITPSSIMCVLDLCALNLDRFDLKALSNHLNARSAAGTLPQFVFALASFPVSFKTAPAPKQTPPPKGIIKTVDTAYGKLRLNAGWNLRFGSFQLFRLLCSQALADPPTKQSAAPSTSNITSTGLVIDPSVNPLQYALLGSIFSHLQALWSMRAVARASAESKNTTSGDDEPSVWTCDECSYLNETGVEHCGLCNGPWSAINLGLFKADEKPAKPIDWAAREAKMHYSDVVCAWFKSDLADVKVEGKVTDVTYSPLNL